MGGMNLGNSSVGMGNAMSGVEGIGQNNLLGGSLGGVPMDNSAGLLANPVLSGFSSGMQGGFQGGFQGGLPLGMGKFARSIVLCLTILTRIFGSLGPSTFHRYRYYY